jgi:glucosyl-3-phosphoglycerate synthase
VLPHVEKWFAQRTSTVADWPVDDLLRAKASTGLSVSVVLPALNEAGTVGAIVAAIRRELHEAVRLVDEIVVIDSGSTDGTAAMAAAAGATVLHADDLLARTAPVRGKGDAMWRSLLGTSGDLIVFVDADLEQFSTDMVTGLLGPMLTDAQVRLVKGLYDRPLHAGATVLPAGGGRVTELVARPMLNLHWPDLAGLVQPLAGEWAARRDLLERLSFPCGYGVEIAVLIDTLADSGLDAIAQVDLGMRRHRHQDDASLGRMAVQVWHAMLTRLPDAADRADETFTLTQYQRDAGRIAPRVHEVNLEERAPMARQPEYVRRQVAVGDPSAVPRSCRSSSGSR